MTEVESTPDIGAPNVFLYAPIVGAILANLLFHGATMTAVPDPDTVSRLAYVLLPGSTVAAVVCWLLVKRFVR
jgi:hypothetical protein